MTKKFEEEWNEMSIEEKNVIVSSYLKTLTKWNLKRILCNVRALHGRRGTEKGC